MLNKFFFLKKKYKSEDEIFDKGILTQTLDEIISRVKEFYGRGEYNNAIALAHAVSIEASNRTVHSNRYSTNIVFHILGHMWLQLVLDARDLNNEEKKFLHSNLDSVIEAIKIAKPTYDYSLYKAALEGIDKDWSNLSLKK